MCLWDAVDVLDVADEVVMVAVADAALLCCCPAMPALVDADPPSNGDRMGLVESTSADVG